MDARGFIAVVGSDQCLKVFPSNNSSFFRNTLFHIVRADQIPFEVGLVQISFGVPSRSTEIPPGDSPAVPYITSVTKDREIVIYKEEIVHHKFNKTQSTISAFVEHLNAYMAPSVNARLVHVFVFDEDPKLRLVYGGNGEYVLHLSSTLQEVLGFSSSRFEPGIYLAETPYSSEIFRNAKNDMYIEERKSSKIITSIPPLEDTDVEEVVLLVRRALSNSGCETSMIINSQERSLSVRFINEGFTFQLSQYLNEYLGLDGSFRFHEDTVIQLPEKLWGELDSYLDVNAKESSKSGLAADSQPVSNEVSLPVLPTTSVLIPPQSPNPVVSNPSPSLSGQSEPEVNADLDSMRKLGETETPSSVMHEADLHHTATISDIQAPDPAVRSCGHEQVTNGSLSRGKYVLCLLDILENQYIRGTVQPIIGSFAPDSQGKFQKAFDAPIYLPVKSCSFDKIEVSLVLESGNFVCPSDEATRLVLHFRPRILI